jgi:quercetin dioxygenase-like cupin family protein
MEMRNWRLAALVVAALAVGGGPAAAQAAVAHVEGAAIEARLRTPADSAAAPLRVAMLDDRGHHTTLVIHRTESGEAEVHAAWDDILVVRAGTGTLTTGGRVDGVRATGPGEWRGGEIVGGAARALSAGDVVVIPSGIPHRVTLAPGATITYLAVKVRRPASPPPD